MSTYDVPRIPEVRVSLMDKAHSDDFKDHFKAENDEEYHVKRFDDGVLVLLAGVFDSQNDAIGENSHEDEPIEPLVEDQAHDRAAEPARRR